MQCPHCGKQTEQPITIAAGQHLQNALTQPAVTQAIDGAGSPGHWPVVKIDTTCASWHGCAATSSTYIHIISI